MEWIDALRELDHALLRGARDMPAWAITVFYVFTVIGAGWGMILLVPFVIHKTTRWTTLWLFAALAVTNTTVSTLKGLVGRIRPCDSLEWCSPLHVTSPGGWSFPSGHAAGGFTFAVFVSMRVPAFAPVGFVYAVLVAWSRSVLGVHYPTDVLAGAAIGAAIGAAFGLLLRRRERAKKPGPTLPREQEEEQEKEQETEDEAAARPLHPPPDRS